MVAKASELESVIMAVTYKPIDNEEVSAEWYDVLVDMRAAGVKFNVNEGHRTMARQQFFWDLFQAGRGNLAARPSPNAPHIRTGRIDHAIDFSNDGAVFNWLHNKGLRPARTVSGESWHIEVPASELMAYSKAHGGSNSPLLKYGRTGPSIIRLKKLLFSKGIRNFSTSAAGNPNSNRYNPFFGRNTEAAVKRFQRLHKIKADGVVGPTTWKALS